VEGHVRSRVPQRAESGRDGRRVVREMDDKPVGRASGAHRRAEPTSRARDQATRQRPDIETPSCARCAMPHASTTPRRGLLVHGSGRGRLVSTQSCGCGAFRSRAACARAPAARCRQPHAPNGERVVLVERHGHTSVATDGTIVLADPNVSRQHARSPRAQASCCSPPDSTNGLEGGGSKVREHELIDGERSVSANTNMRSKPADPSKLSTPGRSRARSSRQVERGGRHPGRRKRSLGSHCIVRECSTS